VTRTMICAAALAALVLGAVGIEPQTRSLPSFEVDKAWPKLPPKYKVGDPSSFAIDANDNVWLLHRGGEVSDRILHRTGDVKKARRNVVMAGFLGSFLFLLRCS
jgi:hypothetical protein